MNAPYDPNMPFEFLIGQIQNAVDFAAHAETPYTQNQIQATVYNLVFSNGMLTNDLRNWRCKPVNNQTWTNFKPFMSDCYTEWHQEHINNASHKY